MTGAGAVPPPDASPERPLRTLLAPVRRSLAFAVVLQVVASLAALVPLVAIAELARILIPPTGGGEIDRGRVWAVVGVAIGAFVVRFVALMVAAMVTHVADLRLSLGLRLRLVDHLGRVPLAWFGARNSGLVRKTVVEDVGALHVLVAHAALDVTSAVVVPLASLVYLVTIDPLMTLVTVLPVVVGIAAYAFAMRGAMTQYVRYESSLAELNAAAVEFVHGITVVKAFGQSGRAHRRFAESASRFTDFFGRWVATSARASTVTEVATAPLATLAVVLTGGLALVGAGRLDPVDVLPFLLLGLGLGAPVTTLSFGMQKLREAAQAAARLSGVLATPELPVAAADEALRPQGAEAAAESVRFSYDGTTDVLRNVELRLRPGTVTALVGPSGSGKSTLARLVPRFADVADGRVTVGGADVRAVEPAQLYRHVGFVLQEVDLLRISLRDNIRLARPDADDAAVRAAARAAQVAGRIEALPRGYDAVVGEDVVLSGGEAQRVCIARALLADAPVLVLDEATAFADPDSEAAIQDALSTLVGNRTLLVIAHRLHTVVHVDQLVVLDGGRLVETGTHEQLVAAGGRYAQLWAAAEAARDRVQVADVPGGAA